MRQRVYHWTLAARIQHWVRTIAIFALIFTGYFIHAPFIPGRDGFLMSTMRMVHFLAAYVLIIGVMIRLYFAFRKDIIGDWRDFNPIKNLKNTPDMIKYYLFLKGTHREYSRYNPIQALVYLVMGFFILVQAATGFALYSGAPVLHDAFNWINRLLGGEAYTRTLHYVVTWIFVVFIPIHVYLGILQTVEKKDSAFFSIFTGYKTKGAKIGD